MRPLLITGGAGLLGRALLATAPTLEGVHATQRHTPVVGAQAHTVELSDKTAVEQLFAQVRPRLVFHTAYSMEAGERDIWLATCNVVHGCLSVGAELVYLSTDALLDGEQAPYPESAMPAPVTPYGEWKARAEAHVREAMPGAAVVRTSLITSFTPPDPRTQWVQDALRHNKPIQLYVDEIRCPIEPTDLARQLWEIAGLPAARRGGIWHLVGPEAISRYTLGVLIAARAGLDPSGITPSISAASPSPRPRDLRLLTARADRTLTHRARSISSLLL